MSNKFKLKNSIVTVLSETRKDEMGLSHLIHDRSIQDEISRFIKASPDTRLVSHQIIGSVKSEYEKMLNELRVQQLKEIKSIILDENYYSEGSVVPTFDSIDLEGLASLLLLMKDGNYIFTSKPRGLNKLRGLTNDPSILNTIINLIGEDILLIFFQTKDLMSY